MTLAVCVRCGNSKVGAFTPCDGCGLDPARGGTDRELQARSLLLTDRFFSPAELESFGRKLRAGEPVSFDADQLARAVEELKTQKLPIVSTAPAGCSVVAWSLVGLAVAVGAALVYLWGPGRA